MLPQLEIGDMHTCRWSRGHPTRNTVGGRLCLRGCPDGLDPVGQLRARGHDMCICVGPPTLSRRFAYRDDWAILWRLDGDQTAHGGVIIIGCPHV